MNPRADRIKTLWRLSLTTCLFAVSFLAVLFPLVNTDIWWHLAVGREILRTHTIPSVDSFSVLSSNRAWLDVHWLFQLVSFGIWRLGGSWALVVGKSMLFATSVVVLLKASVGFAGLDSELRDHFAIPLATVSLALLVLAGYEYVLARPVVFSLLFMSLFLYFISRYLNQNKWRNLLPLVPIQILWANTQALYPLGVVIIACFFFGQGLNSILHRAGDWGRGESGAAKAVTPLGVVLILVLAASVVTPFGLDGFTIPLKLFSRIGSQSSHLFSFQVSENIPSWFFGRTHFSAVVIFSIVLFSVAASFFLNMKRLPLSRFFLVGAVLVPALMANRNLLLFYWVAGPVFVANMAGVLARGANFGRFSFLSRSSIGMVTAFGILLSMGVVFGISFAQRGSISRPAPFRIPALAVEAAEGLDLGGDVFCSVRYGGYLIWKLYPASKPILDGRLVLRSTREFERYLQAVDEPELFESYAGEYDLNMVILPVGEPNRYRRLIGALYQIPEWSLVFTDGTQTLFVRDVSRSPSVDLSDERQVDRIAKGLSDRFADRPSVLQQARVNLGLLLNQVGEHEIAAKILRHTKGSMARSLLARSLYLGGDFRGAGEICRSILSLDPDDVDALVLSSQMAMESGDSKRAVELAGRALREDPFCGSARSILEKISENLSSSQDLGGH